MVQPLRLDVQKGFSASPRPAAQAVSTQWADFHCAPGSLVATVNPPTRSAQPAGPSHRHASAVSRVSKPREPEWVGLDLERSVGHPRPLVQPSRRRHQQLEFLQVRPSEECDHGSRMGIWDSDEGWSRHGGAVAAAEAKRMKRLSIITAQPMQRRKRQRMPASPYDHRLT